MVARDPNRGVTLRQHPEITVSEGGNLRTNQAHVGNTVDTGDDDHTQTRQVGTASGTASHEVAGEGVVRTGKDYPAPTSIETLEQGKRNEGEDAGDDGDAPNKSASKADWVDYAVSQGESREDAEAATKDDLQERYS